MGHPRPLFNLFSVFSNINTILQQISVINLSIQYLVLGFELMTSRMWASSFNHLTRLASNQCELFFLQTFNILLFTHDSSASSIWCWDSNSQPLGLVPPPLTTRPGWLPPYANHFSYEHSIFIIHARLFCNWDAHRNKKKPETAKFDWTTFFTFSLRRRWSRKCRINPLYLIWWTSIPTHFPESNCSEENFFTRLILLSKNAF